MKRVSVAITCCALFIVILGLAPAAEAVAVFHAVMNEYNVCDPTYTQTDCFANYVNARASSSMPTSADDCLTNGINQYPKGPVTVVTVDPPFSGSKSATGYATFCDLRNHDYAVWKMGIDLSGCFAWVCTTKYWYEEVKSAHELLYSTSQFTTFDSYLKVLFKNAQGDTCQMTKYCPTSGKVY